MKTTTLENKKLSFEEIQELEELKKDFMNLDEFKKIIAIQRIVKLFWIEVNDETKLLNIKKILEDEKIFS